MARGLRVCYYSLILLLLVGSATGCRTPTGGSPPSIASRTQPVRSEPSIKSAELASPSKSLAPEADPPKEGHNAVSSASYYSDDSAELIDTPASLPDSQLSPEQLVADVVASNPTLQAMTATWRAATERYPQAIALDDPMFSSAMAPKSFNSSTAEGAYALQASQKLPWLGKREARGRQAQAEAQAAFQDIHTARVELIGITQSAYWDYYLVHQNLALNTRNLAAVGQFRNAALAKYESNQATQQDILQSDLEIAELKRREVELQRIHRVAVARINTLLVRAPSCPLPAPLSAAPPSMTCPPDAEALIAVAMQQRPDLAAISAKIQAESAGVDKAELDFYPDVEVYGRYDTFWQPASTQGDLRGQVGVNMNMPIYREKRYAAVREAQDKVCQYRAEYQRRVADIQYEVQTAYEELVEGHAALEIFGKQIVPTAKQNVKAASANYDSAKVDFLTLLTAQRQLIGAQEKEQQAIADFHRRHAMLEKAIAGPLADSITSSQPSPPSK